jgi:transmembrane sensor
MMTSEDFHIRELMVGRLTRQNSAEQELDLDRLMKEEPALKEQWEELLQTFSQQDIDEKFSRFESLNWKPSEAITAPDQNRPKVLRIFMRLAAAAVVATVCVGAYYLFYTSSINSGDGPAIAGAAKEQNKKVISLQLAGGSTIDLSVAKDSTVNGVATINNTGSQLSYQVKGAVGDNSSMNTLKVPVGLDYQVVFSDGTEIWLNSQTDLQFPFSFPADKREITLNGEAFLKVAKDSKRPFIVHTPEGMVRVLGTSFNVNSYEPGIVKVALVEGSVHFENKQHEMTIKPGTEVVSAGGGPLKAHSFNSDEVLGWREGTYYFNDATMSDIMTVLPRWFGIEVKIENTQLRTELFTGIMERHKPVSVFLDNLKSTMHFQYSFDKEGVLHIK